MATATANSIELCNAAPVDMSIDASSSSPLGEDPATSGVQRLVVALVPDGVGEPDAMAKSIHVLTMVLHDEHVGCTVVGVFVFVPVAVHSVPSSVVPVPQVIAGGIETQPHPPVGHNEHPGDLEHERYVTCATRSTGWVYLLYVARLLGCWVVRLLGC